MSGKARPSLRQKTLENVKRSNLSETDKKCIEEVFKRYEEMLMNTREISCDDCHLEYIFEKYIKGGRANHYRASIKSEAYKEFAERLCDGKVSNDKTVIELKVLLKEMEGADNNAHN